MRTLFDGKGLVKPCFVDLLRVIKVAAGKGVCCKEKHLPRTNTENQSRKRERRFAKRSICHGIRMEIRAGSVSDGKQYAKRDNYS